MNLKQKIKEFLIQEDLSQKSIALGLSGGGDSMALLHLLLPFKGELYRELHLIHVDHSWREESREEANQLRKLALQVALPFHLKVLQKEDYEGNLEASARKKRLQFFEEVAVNKGLFGIFLAHTRDDQVETVLKKMMESGRIDRLKAMQPASSWQSFRLYRPLLQVEKKELLYFLEENQLSFFTDKSNFDQKFLRARMREKILPFLAAQFNKNISSSLLDLQEEIEEAKGFLEESVSSYLEQKIEGPFGTYYDFSKQFPSKTILQRTLLRKLLEERGETLSKKAEDELLSLLLAKKGNQKFSLGGKLVHIDRGRLFFMKPHRGEWKLTTPTHPSPPLVGWEAAFQGLVRISISLENVLLIPYSSTHPGTKNLMAKWQWAKVPTFLKGYVPLLIDKRGQCVDYMVPSRLKSNEFHEIITEIKYELQ